MFVNVSNHSSKMWSAEQLAATSKYGEIVDVQFPNIEPQLSSLEVRDIALRYAQNIVKLIGDEVDGSVIHLAGELSFCISFLSIIAPYGIGVVTSTSNRIVEVDNTGKIIKTFIFEKFRQL